VELAVAEEGDSFPRSGRAPGGDARDYGREAGAVPRSREEERPQVPVSCPSREEHPIVGGQAERVIAPTVPQTISEYLTDRISLL
jgi:hypothetical protein